MNFMYISLYSTFKFLKEIEKFLALAHFGRKLDFKLREKRIGVFTLSSDQTESGSLNRREQTVLEGFYFVFEGKSLVFES